MKRLLFLALFLAGSAGAQSLPYQAVRIVMDPQGQRCSAVVIAPDKALTARHCAFEGLTVDGRPVEEGFTFEDAGKDVMLLTVPGLECPCATLGKRPEVGDKTLAVGFPGFLEGEYRVSAVGTVYFVGPLGRVFPPGTDLGPFADAPYIITNPITAPGDSGGALFAMQDGEWRLVGITSIILYNPASCVPFFGCVEEAGSGFVPIDVADVLLR